MVHKRVAPRVRKKSLRLGHCHLTVMKPWANVLSFEPQQAHLESKKKYLKVSSEEYHETKSIKSTDYVSFRHVLSWQTKETSFPCSYNFSFTDHFYTSALLGVTNRKNQDIHLRL